MLLFLEFSTAWTIAHCSMLPHTHTHSFCQNVFVIRICKLRIQTHVFFSFNSPLPPSSPKRTFYAMFVMQRQNLLCINNNNILWLSYVQCLVPLPSFPLLCVHVHGIGDVCQCVRIRCARMENFNFCVCTM